MTDAPPGVAFGALLEGLASVHQRLSALLTGQDHNPDQLRPDQLRPDQLRPDQLRPDDVRPDELTVAMLGALMASYFGKVCADREHPAFLPGAGYHQRMGMPNPDTVYQTAAIDGNGVYRLTGDRGTAPDVSLMPMGPPGPGGLKTYPAIKLNDFALDAEGRLDVVLSAQRPAGYSGQWREIAPDVATLMLRSVSHEWGKHRDPVFAITRLDSSSPGRRPTPEALAASLAGLLPVLEGSLGFGMRKVPALRAGGFVNAVSTVDYSAGGGLAGQWYHEGVFDIPTGTALVIEADLRSGVETLSLALTDALGCTLDWTNAQTSLNHRQADIDADGFLRLVVAAEDPGIANWLDTMGYNLGVMQFRWTGCAVPPALTFRLCVAAAVRTILPPDTPTVSLEERDAVLRERMIGAQLRIFW
jgi:hypothetical protein